MWKLLYVRANHRALKFLMREIKPFSIWVFLAVQPVCALIQFAVGIGLDNTLRELGVNIHPWKEAFYAALGGIFFMTTCAPLAWRVGLVTIPQYFLAAMALLMPATIIWLFLFSPFSPIQFEVAHLDVAADDSRALAMSIYIRIARSTILSPVYVLTFWYLYHHILRHDNTRGTHAARAL